jgi:hypothetical protein
MVDFSTFHNPYDFSNPVSDIELFAGRKHELKDITYYLNHAAKAPRAINLALLGRRASGKTSILNIIEKEAEQLGFCPVRVDLDEGDAQTQLAFFYKLFDSILLEACEMGAFGGVNSTTYQTYLDMMCAHDIPDDKTFCPFLFPLQHTKAVSCGNNDNNISDNAFKRDLAIIQKELNKPIIILFDECNVLSEKRIHLEKIRNIFMNISGFMLVFTGTPELFPVIDDIFSPIVRQFKKINVGDFEDKQDTKECIIRPLEKIGIHPTQILDIETYSDIAEIHNLSGGRPYEIQLICHLLFRRVQQKRAKRMKLDLSILEDVRKELVTSQSLSNRPVLSKIINFDRKELSALSLIYKSNEKLTFEQLWLVEYIFNGEQQWSKTNLKNILDKFIEEKIFHIENDIVRFYGDEFDKIYIKYYAREQGISINFSDASLNSIWDKNVKYFMKDVQELTSIDLDGTSEIDLDISVLIDKLGDENTQEDVFVEFPANLVKALYFLMVKFRNDTSIFIIKIEFILPWLTSQYWYYCKKANSTEIMDDCINKFEFLKKRIQEVQGGDLLLQGKEISVIPIEILLRKVSSTANQLIRHLISVQHIANAMRIYFNKTTTEDIDLLFHANVAYDYISDSLPDELSMLMSVNLGYLFTVNNEYTKARSLLENVTKLEPSIFNEDFIPLANYNLGILALKEDKPEEALNRFNTCLKIFQQLGTKENYCSCLLSVNIEQEELVIREVVDKNAELITVASNSKKVLEEFLAKIKI